jgi:hypothetical protein
MGEPLQKPQFGESPRAELRDAVKQIMVQHVKLATAPPPARPSRVPAILAMTLGLVAAYLWIGNPSWLRDPVETPSPAYQESSLRWVVYLTSQRIEQYRISHHQLPATLAQAGGAPAGIRYEAVDDRRYRVTAAEGNQIVQFESTDDPKAFLGGALRELGLARRAAR